MKTTLIQRIARAQRLLLNAESAQIASIASSAIRLERRIAKRHVKHLEKERDELRKQLDYALAETTQITSQKNDVYRQLGVQESAELAALASARRLELDLSKKRNELAVLRGQLESIRAAYDSVVKERDAALAEVSKFTAERDEINRLLEATRQDWYKLDAERQAANQEQREAAEKLIAARANIGVLKHELSKARSAKHCTSTSLPKFGTLIEAARRIGKPIVPSSLRVGQRIEYNCVADGSRRVGTVSSVGKYGAEVRIGDDSRNAEILLDTSVTTRDICLIHNGVKEKEFVMVPEKWSQHIHHSMECNFAWNKYGGCPYSCRRRIAWEDAGCPA